jgi:DNA-binding PadR family transcriptional regulator
MPSRPRELTTTSYAILGLLAIKPWTTYELAQQMGRALGQFWPRAQSKLYEEPKKLVAHGLARANEEAVGRRPRTVYSITAKGRRALAAWVPTPSSEPAMESEHLVKIFFAEHASRDDLLGALAGLKEQMRERMQVGIDISQEYLDGRGTFPERLPWLILVGGLLGDFNYALYAWADRAMKVVSQWPDDITEAEPDLAWLAEEVERDKSVLRGR